MSLAERMIRGLYRSVLGVELPDFPVMSYAEAIRLYGIDRPDLRNPLQFTDVADLLAGVEFKVFNGPGQRSGRSGGSVAGAGCRIAIAQSD